MMNRLPLASSAIPPAHSSTGASRNGRVRAAATSAAVATPVLERLVTALASAVDSSYSVGITGAKLAITRALAILGA